VQNHLNQPVLVAPLSNMSLRRVLLEFPPPPRLPSPLQNRTDSYVILAY